ncbi:MAG: phenylalanine--tRNA ligase subunit alpha, partial [Halanaerobiales bacterium]
MDLRENLKKIEEEAEQLFSRADSLEKLEELRIVFLGKKGKITDVLKQMGKMSPEERPVLGQA